VIGVGVMGADHARRLLRVISGAMVSAVTDFDTDRAHALTAELDAALFPTSNEHIAADEDDAVVIASCDADHATPVMSCLTHRKPVLCEKPLAECCAVVDAPVAVKQP
jgi:myo-inositol 2-dehydrogenase/D-chiro-inositol 1-dehydrogenase